MMIAFHKELRGEINSAPCGMAAKLLLFKLSGDTFTYLATSSAAKIDTVETYSIPEELRYDGVKMGAQFFYDKVAARWCELFSYKTAYYINNEQLTTLPFFSYSPVGGAGGFE
jgi:hypothetical protein